MLVMIMVKINIIQAGYFSSRRVLSYWNVAYRRSVSYWFITDIYWIDWKRSQFRYWRNVIIIYFLKIVPKFLKRVRTRLQYKRSKFQISSEEENYFMFLCTLTVKTFSITSSQYDYAATEAKEQPDLESFNNEILFFI